MPHDFAMWSQMYIRSRAMYRNMLQCSYLFGTLSIARYDVMGWAGIGMIIFLHSAANSSRSANGRVM